MGLDNRYSVVKFGPIWRSTIMVHYQPNTRMLAIRVAEQFKEGRTANQSPEVDWVEETLAIR